MSNLKVEGKVGDFCPNCKNCKAVTRTHDGKNASIRIIEVDCEDPYDGMTKTLDADSDICCSMFEPKHDKYCKNCERFDGTYCYGSDGTISISYKALFGEPINCPSYEEKKEKEPFNLNMSREQLELKILDLFEEKNRLNGIINGLEKEKAAHMKGIERLKKSQEKLQNQVKNLQTTNEESYKREEKLEDKYLKKIADQQATHYKQCSRILELENMVNKLQSGEYDDILAKDIEIKSLQAKYEAAMTGWKDAIDTNDKQIEELTRRYNMIAKKLNDIHDILKEDPNNE